MSWSIKDINVSDINLSERRREKYNAIYNKVLELSVGKGFEIETDAKRNAERMRVAVHTFLKKNNLLDKYVACNRLNKFYCGRIK